MYRAEHLLSFETLTENIRTAKKSIEKLTYKMKIERFGNSEFHTKLLESCALSNRRSSDCLFRTLENSCSLSELPVQADMMIWKQESFTSLRNILMEVAPWLASVNSYLEKAINDESEVQDWDTKLKSEFENVQKKAIYQIYCNLIVVLPSSYEFSDNFLENIFEINENECKDLSELAARDNRNYIVLVVLQNILTNLKNRLNHFSPALKGFNAFVRDDDPRANLRSLIEQGTGGKRSVANRQISTSLSIKHSNIIKINCPPSGATQLSWHLFEHLVHLIQVSFGGST
ncbi:hypothetical protein HELRODRAFT_165473 [Helobdella robusta]|uniref:Uncharacterized protein n=1 Tax=Helobdella robusta TaxID=6412 RepID=T1EWV3_HELRO|nr:hypothetical protein HELRODRAFT_165473 [Helobdella robusta]ESN91440.1 hypothetical protein HELRODRAFT_165473 [Helobdella robusta]